MSGVYSSRPAGVLWRCVFLMALCLLTSPRATSDELRPWLGTWEAALTRDSKTAIRFTGPIHAPGEVVDIGFFDPDGKERAIVAARHGMIRSSTSYDGYLLIWGTITGQQGRSLTLYSPYGKREWEIAVDPTALIGPMEVALGGHRSAITVTEMQAQAATAEYVLLLDQSGSQKRRHVVRDMETQRVTYLTFTGPDDKHLFVATMSAILLFNAEDLNLRWDVAVDTRVLLPSGVALSGDLSTMALLDGIRVRGRRDLALRMTFVDATTGGILRRETLPARYEDMKADGLRYDAKQKAFVVQTKHETYTLAPGERKSGPK